MLSTDPRRLWATGLTIENTDTRMWYFDRSMVIVSSPFNFMQESCISYISKSLPDISDLGSYSSYPILGRHRFIEGRFTGV